MLDKKDLIEERRLFKKMLRGHLSALAVETDLCYASVAANINLFVKTGRWTNEKLGERAFEKAAELKKQKQEKQAESERLLKELTAHD